MNFAVIAPFKELAEQIEQVCIEQNYNVTIAIGDLNDGLEEAKKILSSNGNIEAIISRGGTAKLIEETLNIPVVPIEISVYDLLRAIDTAKKYGNKIGVIGFKNVIHGSESLGEYLGVEIEELEIMDQDKVHEIVEKAKAFGFDAVIGDHISWKISESMGVNTVRVHSGKEAIMMALSRAKDLANIRKNEKVRAEQFRAILETAHEGIVAADDKGIITLANNAAKAMLKKKELELYGKRISSIVSAGIIDKVYNEKTSFLGEIYKVEEGILVQNIVPLIIHDEIQGMVITMTDADYVGNVEAKVRKELYLKGYVASYNFSDIVTNNDIMKSIISKAVNYSKFDLNVLIIGESGTGKEMFAQSIHNASDRKNGPFIAVNSAVMPENLLESELFGYEDGAFTGARKGGKKGLFELAHNGTLFLDEIGEIPLKLQARLLRVLQEKSIMRVGGDKVISINTRIIAATHIDLKKAVEEGKFRQDLYYRLNVLSIKIPSLNERKEDIPSLVKVLNDRITRSLGITPPIFRDKTLNYLSEINWKGNVRQIENVLFRLAVLYSGKEINIANLEEVLDFEKLEGEPGRVKIDMYLDKLIEMEKEIIAKTLQFTNNDKEKTCEILGLSKTTLWRRLKD
jgi:transcriptional regulator with PAS, ATPase and Fis domain